MKYIIYHDGMNDLPIVFPKSINHDTFLACFPAVTLVSAGFYKTDDEGHVVTYGKSHSLNLNSRPEDADILLRVLDA